MSINKPTFIKYTNSSLAKTRLKRDLGNNGDQGRFTETEYEKYWKEMERKG